MASREPITDKHGAAADARWNYRLGVLSGAVGGAGMAFQHPELIIAGLIYALTGSPMLVALVTIISKAGILTPQLWASTHLEHRPRKMPYFVLATIARGVTLVGLLFTMWLLSRGVNALSLSAFFAAYLLACFSTGAGYVVFIDLVGRIIPVGRLGSFFGTRMLLGNLLAIVAGLFVIQPVLHFVPLPMNYLLVLLMGGVLVMVSMTIFSRCRERPGPIAKRRTTLGESLRRGFKWIRTDHDYRMFLWNRVAFRFSYLGLAFFIPYGTEKLKVEGPGGMAVLGGILVATMQSSRLLTSILWGKLADRYGYRPCLVGGSALFVLAPLLALLAPLLPSFFHIPIPGTSVFMDLPLAIYFLALIVVGAALQGIILGGNHFIVSHAPKRRRASYMGFQSAMTTPLTLLPLLGAFMASSVGMSSVFILAVGGGIVMLAGALRMKPAAPTKAPMDRIAGVP